MTESTSPPSPPVPALLTAPVLVVVQQAKVFSTRAEYDIYEPDGTPLGSVHQVPGSGAGFSASSRRSPTTSPPRTAGC